MNRLSSIICFIGYFSSIALADVLVYTRYSNQLTEEFRDLPARFGQQLPTTGLKLFVVNTDPDNIFGCLKLKGPPIFNDTTTKWGVLMKRSNCTFEVKVRNAQTSGFDAVIVYNDKSNDLETMSAKNADDITIPSVFVGETTGNILITSYQYPNAFVIVINDDLPFNINTHLILPFSIVVGLVFIIIVGFMIVKCVREQRRLRRRRLPRSVLKTIPIVKYNKTHPYETCAICLDDYVEGDKLRVLPCAHAYHSKCIDPWLLKTRRVCPVCKRKVLPRRHSRPAERHSSEYSSSDSDADDTTPLINPVENTNNHGTFMQMPNDGTDNQSHDSISHRRENPFNRSVNDSPDLNEERQITYLSRIISIFRRSFSANQIDIIDDANAASLHPNDSTSIVSISVDVPTEAVANSSNNILNVNLGGSFRDTSSSPTLMARPLALPQQDNATTLRVGVAALPNANFNRSTAGQRQSQSSDYTSNSRDSRNNPIF